MLQGLLRSLLRFASDHSLPVPAARWQEALYLHGPPESVGTASNYMAAIQLLLENLGTPVLVLWGERHTIKYVAVQ